MYRHAVNKHKVFAKLSTDGQILELGAERPGINYAGRRDWMGFGVRNFNGVGKYAISSDFSFGVNLVQNTDVANDRFYTLQVGELVVSKFDPANKIISGEFSFTAKNKKNGEMSNVTQGRFDLIYQN